MERLESNAGQRAPKVIVELVDQGKGFRTSIKTNINLDVPNAWPMIIQMLQSATQQATVEDYLLKKEGGAPRIVVPEVGIKKI
jgi:hypothetical protein